MKQKDCTPVSSPRQDNYVGRFAPSPSGPLHFGSLVAAVASYCDARAHNGRWLVRMEDIDQPRCMPGADRIIINTLKRFGFIFDEPVLYQSYAERQRAYTRALERLQSQNRLFYCTCTRKQIKPFPLYPGTCRQQRQPPNGEYAIRIQVPHEVFGLKDRIQGPYQQNLATDCGDFIVFRKNGYFAYQLAVVVDDAEQGVTDIVRGIDILDSTPRQLFLQRQLGLTTPRYAHIPVVVDANGHKLSKQTFAKDISREDPHTLIRFALSALGQQTPPRHTSLSALWQWAIDHWDIQRIRGAVVKQDALNASSPL